MEAKRCCRCKTAKPVDRFSRHRSYADGLQLTCKDCSRAANQRSAAKNAARRHRVEASAEKLCSGCRKKKPLTAFGVDRARRDGRHYYCRECHSARNKRNGMERIKKRTNAASLQVARTRACSVCRHEKAIECFGADRWRVDGIALSCLECVRTARRIQSKAWRQRNPERFALKNRADQAIRRARLRGATIEAVEYQNVLARCGRTCHICGDAISAAPRTLRESLTFDHIVPLARGGAHAENNLAPAHYSCNSSKHVKVLTPSS